MDMDLPKNIVQIGKPDKIHKIFVEDYVVSYIKQLNKACDGKPTGVAFYGRLYEEQGCRYYFLYGAAKITGLEHRAAYLSQVEKEEIGDIGTRYFEDYKFLAWCSVKEEPVESFFVDVHGKGMEIGGYACFYEKNECMLNYMLLTGRQEKKEEFPVAGAETRPARGEWKSEDYRKPVENRREAALPQRKTATFKIGGMKAAAAVLLLALCVIGITTLNDFDKLGDLQVVARQVIASLTEKKLPDFMEEADNPVSAGNDAVAGLISGEEEDVTRGSSQSGDTQPNTEGQEPSQQEDTQANPTGQEESAQETSTDTADDADTALNDNDATVTNGPIPVSYTIVKGDTLISICRARYGSMDRVQEICELNGIKNPDNIAVGQTILLP